jgi:hypothetical protein
MAPCRMSVLNFVAALQVNRALCFGPGVDHINIIADPATHTKKEICVSTLYSWQQDHACFGDAQVILPGDQIMPDEQDMMDHVAVLANERRLERVATFRQLQAYSNTLLSATSGRLCLDSFRLPPNVHAHPVRSGEVRVLRAGLTEDEALVCNRITGDKVSILPDGFDSVKLVILGLDQGSIGCAGHAFAESHMEAMVHTKYDKLHRIVRDVKLSFQRAAGGVFLKAQVYSSYVWGVNHKPFGSGRFGDNKRRLLNVFLQTEVLGSRFVSMWMLQKGRPHTGVHAAFESTI